MRHDKLWSFIVVFLVSVDTLPSLIIEGTIETKEDWIFIARFCYQAEDGSVTYRFQYPQSYCCQDAVLYYDEQWPRVYPQTSKSCVEKLAITEPDKNQILTLMPGFFSGCRDETIEDARQIVCFGSRPITSVRARWWYFALAKCGSAKGLKISYELTLTNGKSFWSRHFSADEKYILQVDVFYLIADVILLMLSVYSAYTLALRQLLHVTFKMFIWIVSLELCSVAVNVGYYVGYGLSGRPKGLVKDLGMAFHFGADVVLVMMLVLLGKGWTITRGRISSGGQIKIGVFCALYSLSYIALFIYEAKMFDPGKVLYTYESPAGVGLCILKSIAWLWFCYGIFFTIKHNKEKILFYLPFSFFYTIWFLCGPISVLVAAYVLEAHVRAQVVHGIDRALIFLACLVFLVLTRPSAANKNFPYHVRTSQVGVVEAISGSDLQSFATRVYSPDSEPDNEDTDLELTALPRSSPVDLFQASGSHDVVAPNSHQHFLGQAHSRVPAEGTEARLRWDTPRLPPPYFSAFSESHLSPVPAGQARLLATPTIANMFEASGARLTAASNNPLLRKAVSHDGAAHEHQGSVESVNPSLVNATTSVAVCSLARSKPDPHIEVADRTDATGGLIILSPLPRANLTPLPDRSVQGISLLRSGLLPPINRPNP